MRDAGRLDADSELSSTDERRENPRFSDEEEPAHVLPASEPGEKRSRLVDLLIVLAVAIGSSALAATFALFGSGRTSGDGISALYVSNFIFHEIVALLLLAYVLSRRGRDLASIGVSPRLSDVPWSLLVAIVHIVVFLTAYAGLNRIMPPATEATPETLTSMATAPLALLAAMVIINPAFEELIVRGYAATELTDITGSRWIAAGLTVVVQAYYHLYQGTRHAVAYAFAFAVFAVYFAVTRRILPVVLAHLYVDAYGIFALAFAARRRS